MGLVEKHREKLFRCWVWLETRLYKLNLWIGDEEINTVSKHYLFRDRAVKGGCADTGVWEDSGGEQSFIPT